MAARRSPSGPPRRGPRGLTTIRRSSPDRNAAPPVGRRRRPAVRR
jgi:hypothetical protein